MNLINKINNFSNVREKKFDFVIYPLDLIITVGLDYKTLCDRFENMEPEHNGEWGSKEDMDKEASFVNLVRIGMMMVDSLYFGTFRAMMI